jgi:Phage integrase family
MRLWPKAILRRIRFHDLRHGAATMLFQAGVDVHRVQRLMRHADVRTTTRTYAHLEVEDLRQAVETTFEEASRLQVPRLAARGDGVSVSLATPLLPASDPTTDPNLAGASIARQDDEKGGVSEGNRTLNTRSHSPVLYR